MTSSYAYQLQFYLRYFKRESILVIPFEWLRDRPEYFLQQISNFMNIDNVVLPDQRKYYAAESKYLIKRFDWAKRSLPPAVRKYYHAFFHLLAIKHPKPVLNENTKRELRARLQKDIDELKIICGYDFPEWKVYDAAGK